MEHNPLITPETLRSHALEMLQQQQAVQEHMGMFTVRDAAEWLQLASARPKPQMLFGPFWYQGEICILFADTNLGKSILAVQIANSISRSEPIYGFPLETGPMPVLYFDFELSDKQFEHRYSNNYTDHYPFTPNFKRVEIDTEAVLPEHMSFEDYLYQCLERVILETGIKVLIIDNITFLRNENEKASDALPLMKQLKALKSKYGLSIMVLAHTPKRDLSKAITRNDLQGSKMLINFCDSAFAVGESVVSPNLRYLKQIKQRNCEQVYDAANVAVCQITKPHNFLQFEFLNTDAESHHLKQTDKQKEGLESKIKEMMMEEPGITEGAIARALCTDEARYPAFRAQVYRIVRRIRKKEEG